MAVWEALIEGLQEAALFAISAQFQGLIVEEVEGLRCCRGTNRMGYVWKESKHVGKAE